VKAGVEQLDRGEYTEYGVDCRQEFVADIKYRDLEALFGVPVVGNP
jgi:hypothetical protein